MKRLILSGILVALALAVACAPRAVPGPVPPPAAPAAPTVAAPAAPALSPDEAAWEKVMQAANQEGKVTIYVGGLLLGNTGSVVIKAMDARYGLKLEIVGGTSPVLAERIRMERHAKKYIADVFLASQALLLPLRDEGMLQPVGFLPAAQEKDVWFFPPFYDPPGNILSFGKYWLVSYVNTNLVKPGEEPKSYLDLLKPQWKGKMITTIPALNNLPVTYSSLKFNKALDVDDFFRRLAQQDLKMVASHSEQATSLSRGEYYLGILGQEVFFNNFIREGAPLKPIYMEEGIPLRNLVAYGFLNEATHPNAARVFLNWMFTAEGQRIISEANNSSPSRKDAPDFSPVSKIITPQAKIFFPQNETIDLEAARVMREQVIDRLLGMAK